MLTNESDASKERAAQAKAILHQQAKTHALTSVTVDAYAGIGEGIAVLAEDARPVAAFAAQHGKEYRLRNLAKAEAGILEVYQRMLGVEIDKVSRAAKVAKTFLSRIDAVYDEHHGKLARALCQSVDQWLGVANSHRNTNEVADMLADAHVAHSRKLLLTACECKPEELVDRVAACVADWDQRRPCLPEIARQGDTTEDTENTET